MTKKQVTFELTVEEKWVNPCNVIDVDNSGDDDTMLFGCMDLNDRDQLEGFSDSTLRANEAEWSALVNDYDSFSELREHEERREQAQDILRSNGVQMQIAKDKLEDLRQEARERLDSGACIDGVLASKGESARRWLEYLESTQKHFQGVVESETDSIRNLEEPETRDADAKGEGQGYNTLHWNYIYSTGIDIAEKLEANVQRYGFATLRGLIKDIQKKRNRREMTFEHWVRINGLINWELYRRTGNKTALAKRNRMADLWVEYKLGDRKNNKPFFLDDEVLYDPSSRQFGESKITESELLWAIDTRASASRISNMHNVSFDECITMFTPDETNEELVVEEPLVTNEHTELIDMLVAANMNKSEAARQMGVSRTTVYRRLKKALAAAV